MYSHYNLEEFLKVSKNNKSLTAIKYKYSQEALFFYILDSNETFHLGVEEMDFRLDGYQIRLNDDIEGRDTITNFSSLINIKEGLLDKIENFNIDLSNYETIFNDLLTIDEIVSIEREYFDEDNFFVIGKIVKVTEDSVWLKDFDIDGNWHEDLNIIPYDIITAIRFNSHYINTWSKYLKK